MSSHLPRDSLLVELLITSTGYKAKHWINISWRNQDGGNFGNLLQTVTVFFFSVSYVFYTDYLIYYLKCRFFCILLMNALGLSRDQQSTNIYEARVASK